MLHQLVPTLTTLQKEDLPGKFEASCDAVPQFTIYIG